MEFSTKHRRIQGISKIKTCRVNKKVIDETIGFSQITRASREKTTMAKSNSKAMSSNINASRPVSPDEVYANKGMIMNVAKRLGWDGTMTVARIWCRRLLSSAGVTRVSGSTRSVAL